MGESLGVFNEVFPKSYLYSAKQTKNHGCSTDLAVIFTLPRAFGLTLKG
jgi:hypothetical protein